MPGRRDHKSSESPPVRTEDRAFAGDELFVDLVPKTSWGLNARTVGSSRWRRISELVRTRVEACEGCGATAVALDAHERWLYDADAGIQTLMRLVALCKSCHSATHMGRADTLGFGPEARAHLGRVRGWTSRQVTDHVSKAFRVWRERSKRNWTVEVSILESLDPQPAKRR
jgi:hypothetical protein